MLQKTWSCSRCVNALLLCLALASCGPADDRFRIEGRFRNMNQAEFYLCDMEMGRRDTIHVRDGRFEYERELHDTVQLTLIFPNYSDMPIFAEPGRQLTVKGDASHLKETSIKGSKANEEMTELRLAMADRLPADQLKMATDYVSDHPTSPIALYLVRHFFVESSEPDYQEAYKLATLLAQQQSGNRGVLRLKKQLEPLKNHISKGVLPLFSTRDTKGRAVSNALLKGKVGVVAVWATWSYESQNVMRTLHKLQREYKDKLAVVSISLDAGKDEGKRILERDSIDWPNVCDGKMWQSPILGQLGFATVGANVVTDRTGNIVARNLTNREMKDKLKEILDK